MVFKKWVNETPSLLENNGIIRAKQWFGILVLMLCPMLNIVMLLLWAFNSSGRISKSQVNFARAMIMLLIAAAALSTGGYLLLRLMVG